MKFTQLLSASVLMTAVAATAISAPTLRDLNAGSQNWEGRDVALAGQMDRPTVKSSSLDPQSASGTSQQGATVVRGFPCGVPIPGIREVATTNSHSVITPSGNAALSCHGSTPIVVPQTLVFKDLPCGTLGPAGTDSHLVVTDTGRVNFWCHHHK
jgi:hypothetical protein